MFVPVSSPRASLFPPCAFPVFVCLCHVPSCCCPCLHPSPVPNLPGWVYHWFHLCPVGSPCSVHLCLIVCPALIVLTCPSLSVVYIVCVVLFLVVAPCLVHLCLMVCPALIVLTCPSLSVVYMVCVFLFLVAFLSFHVSCLFSRMLSVP